jgi:hypothetical protein
VLGAALRLRHRHHTSPRRLHGHPKADAPTPPSDRSLVSSILAKALAFPLPCLHPCLTSLVPTSEPCSDAEPASGRRHIELLHVSALVVADAVPRHHHQAEPRRIDATSSLPAPVPTYTAWWTPGAKPTGEHPCPKPSPLCVAYHPACSGLQHRHYLPHEHSMAPLRHSRPPWSCPHRAQGGHGRTFRGRREHGHARTHTGPPPPVPTTAAWCSHQAKASPCLATAVRGHTPRATGTRTAQCQAWPLPCHRGLFMPSFDVLASPTPRPSP